MRDGVLRQRSVEPGTNLRIVVLAAGKRACIGVDLASGAFVRAHQSGAGGRRLLPFDVAEGIVGVERVERPEHPESVDVESPLTAVGRLSGWRLDRLLRPLAHPAGRPLLGFHGSSIPSWQLDGDRPSLALLDIGTGFTVTVDASGVRCQFFWNGLPQSVRFEDPTLLSRLDWLPHNPLRGQALDQVLGFTPQRLVLALSRPVHGHCYKVAAAALPRG